MSNIFISGAGSGLGRAFLHAYASENPENKIYVLDRKFPTDEDAFLGLPQASEWIEKHIFCITCDITLENPLGNCTLPWLDIVIHCAGVRGLNPRATLTQYSDVAKAESLEIMNSSTLLSTFEINAVGTFLLLRALEPHFRKADCGSESRRTRVVVMGSRMGSIGHNTELGGAYAYRASKAALNAIVKSFSIDIPNAIWTIIHPGRVQTGLVAVKEENAMDVNEVIVKDLLPLISKLEVEDSGRFLDRFGENIPW